MCVCGHLCPTLNRHRLDARGWRLGQVPAWLVDSSRRPLFVACPAGLDSHGLPPACRPRIQGVFPIGGSGQPHGPLPAEDQHHPRLSGESLCKLTQEFVGLREHGKPIVSACWHVATKTGIAYPCLLCLRMVFVSTRSAWRHARRLPGGRKLARHQFSSFLDAASGGYQ